MRKLRLRLSAAAFCAWSCLFFAACGLEQVYLLEPPLVRYNNLATASNEDFQFYYVEFQTNETANSAYYPSRRNSFVFLGTEVYYKIYDNVSTLQSHRDSIGSVNTASHYSDAAMRVIETYRYQTLGANPGRVGSPFVECSEKNVRVRIRLTTYQKSTATDNMAGVRFDGVDKGIVPYRNGSRYSFDFFNDANENPRVTNVLPDDGDSDYYQNTSSGNTDTYYVQLYAVAVGRDSNYTPSYSLVLDLGTIPVRQKDNSQ